MLAFLLWKIEMRHMDRLKKRPDFLRAAKGRKAVRTGLVLQARRRRVPGPFRVGFTATKKIGNAVVRNLAKRRLREAARAILPVHATPDYDYVLIARQQTPGRNFKNILQDLKRALDEVHRERHNNGIKKLHEYILPENTYE
jgi:ribonuclease P protein component